MSLQPPSRTNLLVQRARIEREEHNRRARYRRIVRDRAVLLRDDRIDRALEALGELYRLLVVNGNERCVQPAQHREEVAAARALILQRDSRAGLVR